EGGPPPYWGGEGGGNPEAPGSCYPPRGVYGGHDFGNDGVKRASPENRHKSPSGQDSKHYSPPESDGRAMDGSPPDSVSLNAVPPMPGYPQGHIPYHYPTPHPYYPPPPPHSYGSIPPGPGYPPDMWNGSHPSSYYDPHQPYPVPPPSQYGPTPAYHHYPPLAAETFPDRHGPKPKERKKKPRLSLPSSSSGPPPSKKQRRAPKQSSSNPLDPESFGASKSTRRKKKMYSDFVGVTYNKTHAKYQACITHYRKQHYLGRYKLAVDAALAYDESARLLKGSSWKVNFPSRQAYDEAKEKELERIGKAGAKSVDVEGSLDAVAMKVQEIATNVGCSASRRRSVLNGELRAPKRFHLPPQIHHAGYRAPPPGRDDGRNHGNLEHPPLSGPPVARVPGATNSAAATCKVTPSPTLLHTNAPVKKEPTKSSAASTPQNPESPLPASPNPTRHTMGIVKSTPDSAVRPTILTYGRGEIDEPSEASVAKSPSPRKQPSVSPKGDANKEQVAEASSPGSGRKPKASPVQSKTSPAPAGAGADAVASGNSPEAPVAKRPPPGPPLIQNGTLAAASALMTLFGND
ncbi:hypothetical protein ACHAWF_011251, partial [Thalassiosira exigua]